MDVRRILAKNMREFRLAARLSQEQVAERMSVEQTYVSGLERGVRNSTIIMLWRVAVALEVNVAALLVE